MIYARISGTGSYLPENVMTNHDLEKIVETSDQWIRERTGIEQRHIAAEGETTVDLAEKASRMAIESAGIDASEIDLIVLATRTKSFLVPPVSCRRG
jgi:3-oxoacyl-[acyl-carrier-protein] synthase-3